MEVTQRVLGFIQTNCYEVTDHGERMIIDPGFSGLEIARELAKEPDGGHVDLIVATHGHGDHVGGVAALQRATGAPFWIGAGDAERAMRAGGLSSSGHLYEDDAPKPDRLLQEGDEVRVGEAVFAVYDSPGHTEGGIILVGEGVAFTGDTIFAGTVGRTDLPGGDPQVMAETLDRLKGVIPPETVIYPGHGRPTTMAEELRTNPYLI